jgi:hypothetical protein
MATFTMPPIDLYPETDEDDRERFDLAHYTRERDQDVPAGSAMTTPRGNGEIDAPALDAGNYRLDQVLGW